VLAQGESVILKVRDRESTDAQSGIDLNLLNNIYDRVYL
jgi:hypothetical protein